MERRGGECGVGCSETGKGRGKWELKVTIVWESSALLGLAGVGNAERQAAVVVGFGGGGQVEIGHRNFFGVLRIEVPQRLPDDGVVADFLLVLVAEDEHGVRQNGRALGLALRGTARRRCVDILITVGLFLLHHLLLSRLLFIETLLVHIFGDGSILVVICIIGRVGIPPPEGIVKSAIQPRIRKIAATWETEASIAESGSKAIAAEAIAAKWRTREGALVQTALVQTALRQAALGQHLFIQAALILGWVE